MLLIIHWGWRYNFLFNVRDLNTFYQILQNKLCFILIFSRVFNYFRGIFILLNF